MKIAILRCLKTHLNVGVEPQNLAGSKLIYILLITQRKKFLAQTGVPRDRTEKTEFSWFEGYVVIYLYVNQFFSNFAELNLGEPK